LVPEEESPLSKRTRDPARKDKILAAAADLLAHDGYHAVSMAEIGRRAGITGSGIYRHFESKSAILSMLFEQVIDELLAQGQHIVGSTPDLNEALDELIRGQVEFVVNKRALAQIYHNEISSLPQPDQVRLRRKQRLYIEEWVHLLGELTGADEPSARTLTYIAIGGIQAVLFHQLTMPQEQLSVLLTTTAHAVLGTAPAKLSSSNVEDTRLRAL
jgi:AcrR family transcriptional regulator